MEKSNLGNGISFVIFFVGGIIYFENEGGECMERWRCYILFGSILKSVCFLLFWIFLYLGNVNVYW